MVDADGVYRKRGRARVFTREHAAVAAIKSRGPDAVRPGDVLVLICGGPLGTGMEETYQVTSALRYLSWGREVAVLTDARFSGVSTGACIGHISPEALAGGPIGKVRDGPHPSLPADTRLWAALQQASGGIWGGCVYDVDAVIAALGHARGG